MIKLEIVYDYNFFSEDKDVLMAFTMPDWTGERLKHVIDFLEQTAAEFREEKKDVGPLVTVSIRDDDPLMHIDVASAWDARRGRA
jgi:hypothetical protein